MQRGRGILACRTRPTGRTVGRVVAACALLTLAACSTAGNDASESAGSSTGGTVDMAVKKAVESQLNAPSTTAMFPSAADQAGNASQTEAGRAATPATTAGGTSAASGTGTVGAIPANVQPVDLGRSIVFTATVQVEVESVAVANDRAMTAIASVGGFLFGQRATTDPLPSSVLTFKVPPRSFADALTKLTGLGTLKDQNVSSEDVTERVVDLQSRILSSEASVKRLRELLTGAGDINTIAALEGQLLQRETSLEQLRGQLRTMQNLVDLATIELTLTQPQPPGPGASVVVTFAGGGGELLCPAEDELDVTEGDTVQVCYEVTNTGSTTLTRLSLRDPGLDLDPGDLKVLEGSLDEPLAPGARLLLGASRKAAVGATVRPQLRAQPVDAKGEVVRSQVRVEMTPGALRVEADDRLPGFGESLRTGWHALGRFVSAVLVLAGVLLPFIWVPAVVIAVLAWRRRRRAGSTATSTPTPNTPNDTTPPAG